MSGDFIEISRRLLRSGPGVIGLVPAGAEVELGPFTSAVASAMVALTDGHIGIFDPWRSWPAEPLAEAERSEEGAPYRFSAPGDPDELVSRLALPRQIDAHLAAQSLEHAVRHARREFAHVLLDLSGFLPSCTSVLAVSDVLATVAASGHTKQDALLALVRLLPPDRHLGVIVLD